MALEQVLLRIVPFSPVSIITVIFVGDCMWGFFDKLCECFGNT